MPEVFDSTLIAGFVTGLATLAAAAIPVVLKSRQRGSEARAAAEEVEKEKVELQDAAALAESRLGLATESATSAASLGHQVTHRIRKVQDCILATDFSKDQQASACFITLHEEIQRILNLYADHLGKYVVGEDVAGCVKLLYLPDSPDSLAGVAIDRGLDSASGEPSIFSFVRDARSQHFRDEHASIYPISECTAFEKIHKDGLSYFAPEEDLEDLQRSGRYKNPTPEFWNFYRSSIVVPIRRERLRRQSVGELGYEVVGFVAFDTMKVGGLSVVGTAPPVDRFDRQPHYNAVAALADALYWPLKSFVVRSELQDAPSRMTDIRFEENIE